MSDTRLTGIMYRALDRLTLEATVYLLVAGLLLIGASLASLDGSAVVVGVLLVAAVALFAVRQRVPSLGTLFNHDLQRTLRDLWIAPALAATTTAVALGASPGELQSLGGVLGLVAMLNYFLRPVYYGAYSLVASGRERTRPENS
jgi:hypothetical protein